MANKTQQTRASVSEFIDSVEDSQNRADCRAIAKLMRAATGKNAKMWGNSMVGYGRYDYRYASGREGTFFITGFSPRAQNISIYIVPGFSHFGVLMNKLGKYKTGKSCLHVRSLEDVHVKTLRALIEGSVKYMRKNYVTY